MLIVTVSEPELPCWLVQEAEQDIALVDDQVSIELFSKSTEVG